MTESKLDVSPSGLRGLNRLAIKLNTMVAKAQITDWHLGRWTDVSQTSHGILFESDRDAATAKHSLQTVVND